MSPSEWWEENPVRPYLTHHENEQSRAHPGVRALIALAEQQEEERLTTQLTQLVYAWMSDQRPGAV